jgi:hypothetical protein
MNKHWEFISHRPPVFTHADDPLDADDWLKTVGKMLTTAVTTRPGKYRTIA